MTNALKEAIEKVSSLPAETQDKIAEELLVHVDKVRRLRAKLHDGIASLDQEGGRELDCVELIARARTAYGIA